MFAKGKAALEAAAVGSAVVVADISGIAEMITTANFATLRGLNFGLRTLRRHPAVDVVAGELARYDAADAAAVSRLVRETAGHETLVDELLDLYAEVLAERAASSTIRPPSCARPAATSKAWPARFASAISCTSW